MEVTESSITITDPLIISYYRENTNIDIITMNHIFIDILKNLSSNLSNTINTTINSKILSIVTDMNSNISAMKLDIIMKFHEYKKEYIEDIKTILSNNSLTNNEKISALIEKNNDSLLTKTTLIVNDVIPKSQEKNYTQIENCVRSFCSDITKDTTRLLEMSNKNDNSKTILENIDSQFNKMIHTVQQPIFSFIQSTEERTNTGIQQLKDTLNTQQASHQTLNSELKEFLNKYKNNSSSKGNVSETELYYMLQSIMPSDEIIKVATSTANCDFRVNRLDKHKPSILFESKDYSTSVPTDEVKKFERDIQSQKIHGVMVSQKSPITFKDKFQIDIINGFIHIYIPNTEYDTEKIKIAIDIIDNLSQKLENITNTNGDDEFSISKEDIDELLEEYKLFGMQKIQMIDTIKLFSKQMTDKLDEIQLPKLKKLFIKIGNIENDNDFKCSFCTTWSGKNKASLGAHIRNCKFNPKNKDNTVICNAVEITPFESVDITHEMSLEKGKKNKRITTTK